MHQKFILRKTLLEKRNNLSNSQVVKLSSYIINNVIHHNIYKQSSVIAVYYPFKNEVDLSKIIQSTTKTILLPVVKQGFSLNFVIFNENTRLIENKYGIFEPEKGKIYSPENIDMCLMPLCGFNLKGDRLGMGGGFYDRYFALNKMQKKPTILAGIAYDFQENATITPEPWDVPMDIIFTNKETITP